MKQILDKFTYDELKLFEKLLLSYDDIDDLKKEVSSYVEKIEEERKVSLNVRFNMDMFVQLQIFDPWEFRVIRENNINNLQELIDCNLDDLVGITPSIKSGLEWVRDFYDMEKGSRHK